MKILVCLENRFTPLISNHIHEIKQGHITGANTDLVAGISDNRAYVNHGLYAKQLAPWIDIVTRDKRLILIF